ncbi:MAG: hypothetical protein ACHQQ3_00900 [Gemmatimonadales bacterium]
MFDEACERLAAVLRGPTRAAILDAALAAGGTSDALAHLRKAMRTHTFLAASGPLALRQVVDRLDTLTRKEGLHVLEGWDYREHRFPDDIAPVLLLDYCVRAGIPEHRAREALAILLDQYFLSLLALLAVRAWDDGDPNANLDRVSGLLRDLQGPDGSGHRVADDAETLLLLAIAYYNPEEESFDLLARKVGTLDDAHQVRVALPCAAILGGHLRWGLRFMYARDVGAMRDDNVVDYPWLLFAVLTLMRAYARAHDEGIQGAEREHLVAGLLNGLSADPWAFAGMPPACLERQRAAHEEFRKRFTRCRTPLLADLAGQAPSPKAYTPLGFSCNFFSNAVVAAVVVALAGDGGQPQPSLNALLARDGDGVSAERLATRLMAYASAEPERLGARGAPLIAYDPYDAVHCFNNVMRTL